MDNREADGIPRLGAQERAEGVRRSWRAPATIMLITTGITLPLGPFEELGVWLNFGERGLVFEKLPPDVAKPA